MTRTDCRGCERLRLVDVGHRVEALCRHGGRMVPLGVADARGVWPIVPGAECPEKERVE